jgi:LysR family glycine cleavage system transcriptional activator
MRRLPSLSALRAFEAAARLSSFNRAAEELHVTATAISHQIRGLEAYCGQTLFRRWPRPIALTTAGEFLFPVLREGLDKFSTAIEHVRTEPIGARRLKIATTNAFAARCLVPMLPAWRAENPDIELVVIGTDAVVDLQAGEADVALRYARATPRDGVSEELTRDRFYVVAAPSLLAKSSQKIWQRLPRISYDWLPHDKQAPTWERWKEAARDTTKTPGRVVSHFREELHAIEALIAGQGVASAATCSSRTSWPAVPWFACPKRP